MEMGRVKDFLYDVTIPAISGLIGSFIGIAIAFAIGIL